MYGGSGCGCKGLGSAGCPPTGISAPEFWAMNAASESDVAAEAAARKEQAGELLKKVGPIILALILRG